MLFFFYHKKITMVVMCLLDFYRLSWDKAKNLLYSSASYKWFSLLELKCIILPKRKIVSRHNF